MQNVVYFIKYDINRNQCCYERLYKYFHTKDHLRRRPCNVGNCLNLAWNTVGVVNCYLDLLDKL